MTPEPGSLSGRIKNRVESGSGKATEEGGLQKGRTLRDMRADTAGGSEGPRGEKSERQKLLELATAKYKDDTASKELLEALVEINYLIDKLAEKDLHDILSDKSNKPAVLLDGKIELKINYEDPAFEKVFEKLRAALPEENR